MFGSLPIYSNCSMRSKYSFWLQWKEKPHISDTGGLWCTLQTDLGIFF